MVMKHNAMGANLRQSIRRSLGRYIAIMMIIALGGSIFVGLRMTKTDMVATGQAYVDRQNMFDLRLVTSYGWDKDQLEQISQLEGISDAEGVFYTDLIAHYADAEEEAVYRFYALPQRINQPELLGGRMPQAPNECLADGYGCDDSILGTQVVISSANEEDSLEILTETTFTVVGYASTPLYMDMNRGNTSVGNGSIAAFFYLPEDAFDVDYYTEIHLTVPGDYAIYSDAYVDAMNDIGDALEPELEELAQDRFDQVRQEAEDAYADGLEEYQDGLTEYYDGVHEAYSELREAYFDLIDGEEQIETSRQDLIDGEEELEDAKVTLQESRETLAQARIDAYAQLEEAAAELDANHETVVKNMETVKDGLQQVDSGLAALEPGISQLEAAAAQIDASIDYLYLLMENNRIEAEEYYIALEEAYLAEPVDQAWVAQIQSAIQALDQAYSQYDAQIADLETQRQGYTSQLETTFYPQQDALLSQKSQLEASMETLEQALAAIEDGYRELASSEDTMEEEFAAAEEAIEEGQAQIDSNQRKIRDGWKDLEDAEEELKDGWIEYQDGKAEAEEELADGRTELNDARVELADARQTLDTMVEGNLHILDRSSNQGYSSLDSSSDIVAGVSAVFPVFFLLVAALVCITTMTRMVDEERTQIGTLKALGYSNGAIASKYLLYAGSSALLGCFLGTVVGSIVFPLILWEAYKIMLFIPGRMVLTFDFGLCMVVVFSYTLVELLVTWYSCHRTLEEVPAELIRPKAPDAGKPLIFEKLSLWKKLSFLNKVTIRNIFRYHQRLAMMLIGIGGCTALLLTGFGLRDSIVNIVSFQFEDITTYDMEVYFSEEQSEEDQQSFREALQGQTGEILFFHQTSMELDANDQTRELSVIASGEEITQFIDCHFDGQPINMPGPGEVLLSVGVAEAMDIHTGDQVVLRNADMQTLELRVSGIYENYVNNYAIVLPETIQDQWGVLPEQQMAYVTAAPGQDIHQVSAEISSQDEVMNVTVSQDMADLVSNMMEALDLVVVVIVICAALLGATVLYNLTNININERIREIATIKVLGFNAKETAMYIFKENLALTIMGTAVGLGMGKLLLEFVMSQIKIDFVWFQARVLPPSYLWSVVLTILTALIVDFIFYFRLEQINMAEALKSVE